MNIFIYRLTKQTDIVIGTLSAGREQKDFENQIGFYANMLALRKEISKELSFLDVHKLSKENVLASFENQDYPIDLLSEDLNLSRIKDRSLFFDIVIIFHGDWVNVTKQNIGEELYVEEVFETIARLMIEQSNI